MSTRGSYSAAEWETLRRAPIMAGLFVMTGDRPNPFETFQEALGINRGMTQEPPEDARNELTGALIADAKSGEEWPQPHLAREGEKLAPEEARSRALQDALDAIAIVARVSPGEVEGFRRYLYYVADVTARAAREGGFLGIGGKQVSAGETAMLEELADSLGVTPQP